MKKKIVLTVLSLTAAICIFASCGETNPDSTPSPVSEPASTIAPTIASEATPLPSSEPTPTRAPITSFIDHELKDFNVIVKMPEIWQTATTIEEMPPSASVCVGDYGIKFTPKGVMLSTETYIGWIIVYDISDWNSFTDDIRNAYTKLDEIDGNVFVYLAMSVNPFEPGTKAAEIYNELHITQDEAKELVTVRKK